MTDEAPGLPPAKKPRSAKRIGSSGANVKHLTDAQRNTADDKQLSESPGPKEAAESMKQINEMAESIGLKDAAESIRRIQEKLRDSPGLTAMAESVKRINDIAELSGVKNISESIERLKSLAVRPFPAISPDVYKIPPLPERPEVGLLRAVHEELQSMAGVLAAGAQQTAVMVEVTQANLTAVQAVVEELTKDREASARRIAASFGSLPSYLQ